MYEFHFFDIRNSHTRQAQCQSSAHETPLSNLHLLPTTHIPFNTIWDHQLRKNPPTGQRLQQLLYQNLAMFNQGHNIVVTGGSAASNNFLMDLLQETILGAAFNSASRDPPPNNLTQRACPMLVP
ncbi:hypothetical protein AGABI1DRAFT_130534 [Agaricus bisporus var. burnettii JB137-S8]|uniref:Uncharacterized protein n=1 Tax=Agaricus bisporus var. burnettii (strain JB137-S8 / ATCC MYA-4627 / FGSC 10392) TaxID=597362 RepID=K5VRP5_AGABU|nr:uncharacterized protein AGABI1DRAFT_130534 [Agaricus bisporus var. burnettii JB137-S8]EKM77114.1 hypothetical protein AGABI1DRAFT_130534 [Agaricus bisporus var. burnettii JB137-S8]